MHQFDYSLQDNSFFVIRFMEYLTDVTIQFIILINDHIKW